MSRGKAPLLRQSANGVYLALAFGMLALAFGVLLAAPASAVAQRLPGTENGEWHYLGGDAGHTRSSALDQINAGNFEDLDMAWLWRADNFAPDVNNSSKSTPSYIDGILYTAVSSRRQLVAIDPATGETLWTYPRAQHVAGGSAPCGRTRERELPTPRWMAAG